MLYSFIVDNNPKFHLQAYYLLLSLTKLGKIPPESIIVNYAGDVSESFRKIVQERFSIALRPVPRQPHPYCNKIKQLDSLISENDDLILLDCDVVVTRPPAWPHFDGAAAKKVDTATPPRSVMEEIFKKAGLTAQWTESDCLNGHEGRETPVHNYNGGVYCINKNIVKSLHEAWNRWADFCLENISLFGKYNVHVDQVGFALAATELSLPVVSLPRTYNFPTHLSLPVVFDCDPSILHYHWMLDDQQLLKRIGLPQVDAAIDQVNNCITDERKSSFNNKIFWDFRYASDAGRGSGVGSRGAVLEIKTNLLQRLVNAGAYRSIVDIGCGDIETTRRLSGGFRYCGVDASAEALKLAKEKRSDWDFIEANNFSTDSVPEPFDCAICLDVLIHQSTIEEYNRLVDLICSASTDTVIIGGYDEVPVFTSSLTYYYEPITRSLRAHDCFDEIFTVARYRDVSVVVAKKRHDKRHVRDISAEHVNDVYGWTRSPLVFRELLDFSRTRIGFFPDHTPRAVEYSWIVNEVSATGQGRKVMDIGSGVSCLPLFLAARGHHVTTVDQSPYIRKPEQRAQWNEWGFLDYSRLDPGISSVNAPFEAVSVPSGADIIYSVSVIEHLTTPVRRIWLSKMKSLLSAGGRILLTVDLIPPGDDLWIFAEGKVVENNHGTFRNMLTEIQSEGFIIESAEILQALPGTRVDIGLVAARKPS